MVKLIETLWSARWLCGFAVICGVGGYYVCRRAEQWARQAAEATAHPAPMLRWLYRRQYSATEFIWRHRLAGVGAIVIAMFCLLYAVVTIIATAIRGFSAS